MRILQINATCGKGSTGKICEILSGMLNQNKIENLICYSSLSSDYPQSYKFCSRPLQMSNAFSSRLFGNLGFEDRIATKKLIAKIDSFRPNLIQLHNIHSHDVNLESLFSYINQRKIPVVWTMHDCWAVTGCCMHFAMTGCEKWKTECHHCPQYHDASWFADRSQFLYEKKKQLLRDTDLTVVTPSQWLADIMKQSFLKNHSIEVIHNGIDLNIFKPRKSDFRSRYGIADQKKILLGVAFDWGVRKGLDVFRELSEKLDSEEYQIVLVGTDPKIDKTLPSDIISVHKTSDQMELAQIYSAADLFVNPTREDNYPTVNMEAIACGTPVLTFNTGGSPEMVSKHSGAIVACDDIDGLMSEIIHICNEKPYSENDCLQQAKQFSEQIFCQKYYELYSRLMKEE